MAIQETLQGNKDGLKSNGKTPGDILIAPGTTLDKLADEIALYVGLPALLYNGKAEPWLLEPDEEMEKMVSLTMTGESPFMRHITASKVAEMIIDAKPHYVVFTDPNPSS